MADTTTYFSDSDILYLKIGDGHHAGSKILDTYRIADYDENGELLGVEFLEASKGVDLDDLPQSERLKGLLPQTALAQRRQPRRRSGYSISTAESL